MNFLNKKYTPSSQQSGYYHQTVLNQSQSRFVIQTNPQSVRQSSVNNTIQSIIGNCDKHNNQQVRHMCLECVALLCSECISQHLQVHRQVNTFPTIHTLRKVYDQMREKLHSISIFISQHNPEIRDVDLLRNAAQQKLQQVHRQMLKAVQQWFRLLREQMLAKIDYQQLIRVRQQMIKMQEQVNMLNNALNNKCTATVLKKIYQIDSVKLQKAYMQMLSRNEQCLKQAQVQFKVNWKNMMQSLQDHIQISTYKSQISEVEAEQPSQQMGMLHQIIHQGNSSYLYVVRHDNTNMSSMLLPFRVNPLSSSLLVGHLLYISGGLESENSPSSVYYVYDYQNKTILYQDLLSKPRSSHSMIHYNGIVYVVGGFNKQVQCTNVEVINPDYHVHSLQQPSKWGGSCQLALLNAYIYKISIQGLQIMDLATAKWKQSTSKCAGIFQKNMRLQQCGPQLLILFGDGADYQIYQSVKQIWVTHNNNISIGPIADSLYTYDQMGVYALTTSRKIVKFVVGNWQI